VVGRFLRRRVPRDVHPAELEGSIGFALGMADFQHELNVTTVVGPARGVAPTR